MIEVPDEALAEKFARVLPHLGERARRLVLGVEARMLGYGGIRRVARLAGVDEDAVSRGECEIESGAEVTGRVRAVGGGRKSTVEKDPEIVSALCRWWREMSAGIRNHRCAGRPGRCAGWPVS